MEVHRTAYVLSPGTIDAVLDVLEIDGALYSKHLIASKVSYLTLSLTRSPCSTLTLSKVSLFSKVGAPPREVERGFPGAVTHYFPTVCCTSLACQTVQEP